MRWSNISHVCFVSGYMENAGKSSEISASQVSPTLVSFIWFVIMLCKYFVGDLNKRRYILGYVSYERKGLLGKFG